MKEIKKYLLERYPTVWNTHIVLVLPLALVAHLFFFCIGYFGLTDEVMAQYYYQWGKNFWGLYLLLNFVITILLLVGWLILLFKNNAFKHFYPVKRRHLLGQFLACFLIVMSSSSFYMSFIAGEHAKVEWKYTDSYIEAGIRLRLPEKEDFDYNLEDHAMRDYYTAKNADEIKNEDHFRWYLMRTVVFVVIAYIVTLLIFALRITGMRTTLLSVLASGTLIVFLSILLFFVNSLVGYEYEDEISLTIMLFSYLLLFFCSVSLQQRVSKLFSGILLNMAMFFFLPALFTAVVLLFYLLEMIAIRFDFYVLERLLYDIEYYVDDSNPLGFLITTLFIGLCVIGFIGTYTKFIKSWKASPKHGIGFRF